VVAATLLAQMHPDEIENRVAKFNRNYAVLEEFLIQSPHLNLPEHHPKIRPSQDSVQFAIEGLSTTQQKYFVHQMQSKGYKLSILGLSDFNARCFWTWKFIEDVDAPDNCPYTR
jgi:hypothetical protein